MKTYPQSYTKTNQNSQEVKHERQNNVNKTKQYENFRHTLPSTKRQTYTDRCKTRTRLNTYLSVF